MTSCMCSMAFFLLIKYFVRELPTVLNPNWSRLGLSTTDNFFFLRYQTRNLVDFLQLADSFGMTGEMFWAKSSLFTEVQL